MTDLAHHIQQAPLVDTHNELRKEGDWLRSDPDVISELFNYAGADLFTSGGDDGALRRMRDRNLGIHQRFEAALDAWKKIRHTGFGESVTLAAREFYGLEELTPEGLAEAQAQCAAYRVPGARYDILKNRANLDHIQTDDKRWACRPDPSGPDFFLYDLSWSTFCCGQVDPEAIADDVGVTVTDLPSLRQAMDALFAAYGPVAIAVKSTHVFRRTFRWRERSDAEASLALDAVLRKGDNVDETDRLCLGDYCWAYGIDLATQYRLPFKMHTGYFAGSGMMQTDRIASGNLCAVLNRFPDARFVLMHIAYPFSDELVAIAKHYRNAYADLCWAWALNPLHSADFVRRFLHGAPITKLFAFGGDTYGPILTTAHAIQARMWLTRALESEVANGCLDEMQAMVVADRIMRLNQYDCFDVDGTREAIQKAMMEEDGRQKSGDRSQPTKSTIGNH